MHLTRALHLLFTAVLSLAGFHVAAATAHDLSSVPDLSAPSPVAPPETPARSGLACGASDDRPIIEGDIDAGALALLGSGEPIVRNGAMTITAANGTELTFEEDTYWSTRPGSDLIVSGETQETINTVTSLVTGESWEFPNEIKTTNLPALPYVIIGRWLIGVTDDTATDMRIINTVTGAERRTSDIIGEPFDQARLAMVLGPQAVTEAAPRILSFIPTGMQGSSIQPSIVVLPGSDPVDAYTLGEAHLTAGTIAVITADGSRVAYLAYNSDGSTSVRVLDGFTGEQLAEHPVPDSPDGPQVVGATADDTKLILHDSQQVWTIGLDSGETTTVFDPEGTIHGFEFDPTTSTALASAGGDSTVERVWIDPASGEVKTVDSDNVARVPPPQRGWALIMTHEDTTVDYAVLDMATGELATDPLTVTPEGSGSDGWVTGNSPASTGVYVVHGEPGTLFVLDGPGGRAFELPAPTGSDTGLPGIAVDVSPNRSCIVYTRTADEPGTSWIAPLEPDAEWTELPFELTGWLEIPTDTTEP